MSRDDLTLYFSQNSCAIASIAALEETDAPFESTRVQMAPEGAGDEAFRLINPRRQVPVLRAGKCFLRENGAIFAFLNARYPHSALLPTIADLMISALEWVGYL